MGIGPHILFLSVSRSLNKLLSHRKSHILAWKLIKYISNKNLNLFRGSSLQYPWRSWRSELYESASCLHFLKLLGSSLILPVDPDTLLAKSVFLFSSLSECYGKTPGKQMFLYSSVKIRDMEHVCHGRITSWVQPRSGFQGQTCCTTVDGPTGDSISAGCQIQNSASVCSTMLLSLLSFLISMSTFRHLIGTEQPPGSPSLVLLELLSSVISTEPWTLSECSRAGLLLCEPMALVLQGSEREHCAAPTSDPLPGWLCSKVVSPVHSGLPPPLTYLQADSALR